MALTTNYNITRLFITKDIDILQNNQKILTMHLQPISIFYLNNDFNACYHIWTGNQHKLAKSLGITKEYVSSYDILLRILNLGSYSQFRNIYNMFLNTLKILFDTVETPSSQLKIDNITITEEIWEYIVYILKLSCGEKVTQPLSFSSEEAKQFYLAQKENEEKIATIKASKETNADGLIKTFLSITYAFPSITFDFLFNQTMAQIQWLQKLAAGAVSYEVNAQAFAAGNVKKGKKLDFFIK